MKNLFTSSTPKKVVNLTGKYSKKKNLRVLTRGRISKNVKIFWRGINDQIKF